MGFGVGEILHLLDLQASVFVSGDLSDVDRFAGNLYPNFGLNLAGCL